MKALTNFNRLVNPNSLLHQQFSILLSNITILDKIKQCSSAKILDSLYAAMIKTNATQDCYLVNQFTSACTSFHRLDLAVSAFTQMQDPNVFVYNALIRGFVRCFHPFQALEFYVRMLRVSVSPSSFTFSSIFKASGDATSHGFGESVHGQIWKFGFSSHVFVQTALMNFYSNSSKILESKKVFDELPERDIFAWTTMVSAYTKAGDMISARVLFDEMPQKNTATWNCMIDGYARLGNVESVELLFNQMPEKDIISWTTMINCYSQIKRYREALAMFNGMIENGISPDEVTMSTVISACAHLGALDLGKGIHLYLMQNGFELDVFIGSALVDMYAKCGSLERSLLFFFKLPEKNLFCWNSVIEGLASHGDAHEALKMFTKMEQEKIKPNGVTFISVLTACTHAGLIEEGQRRFNSMVQDYSILPDIEHYGCMVDLLSKAGLFQEALKLIQNMEFEPNAVIWGALLGGCRVHKNLELAGVAVSELMVLEPENSGYYTLLVNMYAEQKRWGDVANMRGKMKELGIEKRCPGSSWIEIEKRVHQFAASDKSHLDSNELYLLLGELNGQLKLAGYVPELASVVIMPI